jgi:hypothetical protein
MTSRPAASAASTIIVAAALLLTTTAASAPVSRQQRFGVDVAPSPRRARGPIERRVPSRDLDDAIDRARERRARGWYG